MYILVTGCAGFIGFSLVRELLKKRNFKIVGVDNLKLSLSPPINEESMIHEYSRVSRENDQGSN